MVNTLILLASAALVHSPTYENSICPPVEPHRVPGFSKAKWISKGADLGVNLGFGSHALCCPPRRTPEDFGCNGGWNDLFEGDYCGEFDSEAGWTKLLEETAVLLRKKYPLCPIRADGSYLLKEFWERAKENHAFPRQIDERKAFVQRVVPPSEAQQTLSRLESEVERFQTIHLPQLKILQNKSKAEVSTFWIEKGISTVWLRQMMKYPDGAPDKIQWDRTAGNISTAMKKMVQEIDEEERRARKMAEEAERRAKEAERRAEEAEELKNLSRFWIKKGISTKWFRQIRESVDDSSNQIQWPEAPIEMKKMFAEIGEEDRRAAEEVEIARKIARKAESRTEEEEEVLPKSRSHKKYKEVEEEVIKSRNKIRDLIEEGRAQLVEISGSLPDTGTKDLDTLKGAELLTAKAFEKALDEELNKVTRPVLRAFAANWDVVEEAVTKWENEKEKPLLANLQEECHRVIADFKPIEVEWPAMVRGGGVELVKIRERDSSRDVRDGDVEFFLRHQVKVTEEMLGKRRKELEDLRTRIFLIFLAESAAEQALSKMKILLRKCEERMGEKAASRVAWFGDMEEQQATQDEQYKLALQDEKSRKKFIEKKIIAWFTKKVSRVLRGSAVGRGGKEQYRVDVDGRAVLSSEPFNSLLSMHQIFEKTESTFEPLLPIYIGWHEPHTLRTPLNYDYVDHQTTACGPSLCFLRLQHFFDESVKEVGEELLGVSAFNEDELESDPVFKDLLDTQEKKLKERVSSMGDRMLDKLLEYGSYLSASSQIESH